MKKSIFIILTAIFIVSFQFGYAEKIRVNNSGGGADFTCIIDAIDAALPGDTIYVEGTPVHYEGFTLDTPLVIIGPGYFITDNPETQANPSSAVVGRSTINPGAEGTIIMGMYFYTTVSSNQGVLLTINTNDVLLKRNRFQTNVQHTYHAFSNHCIRISNGISGISLIQNFITRTSTGQGNSIVIDGNCSGIIITNNYIYAAGGQAITMNTTSSAQIINNVIDAGITVRNSVLYNNIMITGSLTQSDCVLSNNIGNAEQFPSGNNLQNIDMTDVFDLDNPSRDAKYILVDNPENPAIGYGVTGEDCGMFGGLDPYRLSGIPPVPAVTFFFGSPTGSNTGGLPLNLKIQSNN